MTYKHVCITFRSSSGHRQNYLARSSSVWEAVEMNCVFGLMTSRKQMVKNSVIKMFVFYLAYSNYYWLVNVHMLNVCIHVQTRTELETDSYLTVLKEKRRKQHNVNTIYLFNTVYVYFDLFTFSAQINEWDWC